MKNASNEIQNISTLIYDDYASKLERYVALNTEKYSGSLSIRVNGSYEIVERGVLSIKEINADIINKKDFKELYERVSAKMNWGSGRSILEFLRWILGLETKVDKIWKAIDFCHYKYKDEYKKQNGLY